MSGSANRLVVASGNAGKLREFGALLAPLGWQPVAQGELGVPEAEEPHCTFVENALAKARNACAHTGLPALADDSGISVPLLGGAPGVLSARYAGEPRSDARNNQKLIATVAAQARSEADWDAYYVAVLVFLRSADDPLPLIAQGLWRGRLVATPAGAGGFGYDPHFFLPDAGCTAAELPAEQKNRVSHRAQALAALVAGLSAR
ncbi:RdgB/HAM1 family non-canonical purine NTP pyrophosphatase [Derxia lacustris]|uniref:RdgB/HAM1 family non-canonical purine NTP pyrophosphatase n=1 Tax=Derxia lacustris TaxID=764842 RepID=UPI000A16CE26|nr:RdgB/HAM1 family non-canonical purine NTP pyrophosphatase [Derxia lacustris]